MRKQRVLCKITDEEIDLLKKVQVPLYDSQWEDEDLDEMIPNDVNLENMFGGH